MRTLFIVALVFLTTVSFGNIDRKPERPKLVVGIVVEGMRPDLIWRFKHNFGKGGFNRLLNEGRTYKNAQYDYLYPESAAAYATMMTGANPSVHGIIANNWYNRLSKRDIYCVEDNTQAVLGVSDNSIKRSPSMMLASTLGDELRLSNFKQSKVLSISLKDYSAILSAGLMGSSAYWFHAPTGKMVTSSYYMKNLPIWVQSFNDRKLPELYLGRTWDTFYPLTRYSGLGDDNIYEYGFAEGKHTFPYNMAQMRYKNNHYELMHYTPYGNTLVREFAVSAIVNENLGKNRHPDVLMLSFTANAGLSEKFGLRSVEIEDAYIRLDQEIETLLDFIDDYVGLQNTLVFLTSDRGSEDVPEFLTDIDYPIQNFNRRGAVILTQSFLKALYDKNFLIEKFTSNGIYFDTNILEQSGIDVGEIQSKTAQFLVDFSGIARTYTAVQLESGNFRVGSSVSAQNQFLRMRSPDVLIEFRPGTVENGKFLASGNRNYSNVPLIFFGWKTAAGESYKRISMTDLAPSLAAVLKVSYPNASTGNPLPDLIEQIP